MAAEKDKNYRPSDKEPFMNERQREYFRQKLLDWKEDILKDLASIPLKLAEVGDRQSKLRRGGNGNGARAEED